MLDLRQRLFYIQSGKDHKLIQDKFSVNKKKIIAWYDQFCSKPIFRSGVLNGRQLVHVLHIGKTGGTALQEALKNNVLNDQYLICKREHGTKLKHIPKGDKIIFVLRDPVKRFVSSFYSRKRKGMPKYLSPWSPCENLAFKHFKTPNELGRGLLSKDEMLHATAECAMRSIGHVKTSFLDWFGSMEYLEERRSDILFVGYQETLSEDFEKLKKILHLDKKLSLPTDPVKAHIGSDQEDKNLDKDVVDFLKKWYKEDYLFLNHYKRTMSCGTGVQGSGERNHIP